MNAAELKTRVEAAWVDRTLLQQQEAKDAIADVMACLDAGSLRVAQPLDDGEEVLVVLVQRAVPGFVALERPRAAADAERAAAPRRVSSALCGARVGCSISVAEHRWPRR